MSAVETPASPELTRDQLLDAYRVMRTIREFEERVHLEFATGEIPGFVHLYAGEEAIAAGVCLLLRDDDYVASTHRGHGHAIAKGCDVKAMMAEIYGKKTGLCHGKGGSMHIADLSRGMLGANGIVGGGPPLACGVGLNARVRQSDQVAVSFTGDGGSNQGTFLESLNLAAAWHLPVVFVIETTATRNPRRPTSTRRA
jgi:TPP-dependent pyruvate/acetoin dehydrogenase alpha subunit